MLGVPTVVDRLICQAIEQTLTPIFDRGFVSTSFGFRPNRSAHIALRTARGFINDGYVWVVEVDLSKYFDTVNHDMLMSRVARKVKDKRVLKLIRAYLNAGIMADSSTGLAGLTHFLRGGLVISPWRMRRVFFLHWMSIFVAV
nr:reverse transcriptase domain-containing protein [Corynebacterium cystitidis]